MKFNLFVLLLIITMTSNSNTQINVDLVRQDDGATIGTAVLDMNMLYAPADDSQNTDGAKKLYFDGNVLQYISCSYSFSSEFDLYFKTQGVSDVSGWIGLCGNNSSNRWLLSNSNQRFWANMGSGTLGKANTLTFDSALVLTTRVYRDSNNDVYIQFNNEAPVFCFNQTNTVTLSHICKGYDKLFKGYLLEYGVNGETWNLSEEDGNTLTGSNGTVHIVQSNVAFSDMWINLPTATNSVQVFNEGVGGNDVLDLQARTSDVSKHNPDHIVLWVGTNPALNALGNKIVPASTFETQLITLVQTLKAENPNATIAILNVIPCIDSTLKATHDYTPHYGDENTFDLNTDVIPSFNTAIENVNTAEGLILCDAHGVISADTSVITDGTHINVSAYGLIASLAQASCAGKTKIVCFGDSHTAGANVSGGFDYPTQLMQLLNQ